MRRHLGKGLSDDHQIPTTQRRHRQPRNARVSAAAMGRANLRRSQTLPIVRRQVVSTEPINERVQGVHTESEPVVSEPDYIMELTCVESVIENEIAQGLTQKDIAQTYALGLRSSWPTDWARVNAAILKRWPKGLNRVKEMAWSGKCFEQKGASK